MANSTTEPTTNREGSTANLDTKSRKPENTAFKQQRLRAWQPILTPRTVLPTLFLIGVLFAPLGGGLLYVSSTVSEVIIDYTDCYSAGTDYSNINSGLSKISLPNANPITDKRKFQYKKKVAPLSDPNPNNLKVNRCTVKFELPESISGTVFLYYQLSNFYQNHRRYVKSVSYPQLAGTKVDEATLQTECEPLAIDPNTKKPYYPCGLIANSIFNDTILPFHLQGSDTEVRFSSTGIAWDSDATKFKKSSYGYDDVVPPPNWVNRYPDGLYTAEHPPPDLSQDEHLQVWMRTAGLPSFRKLYGTHAATLSKGTYEVEIDLNFNTTLYQGRKFLVLSTVSFLGGKNPYLGYAYLSLGGLCVFLGLIFTIRHVLYPRKLGDSSYLSWNQTQSQTRSAVSPSPVTSPLTSDRTRSE